jgi:hypothetical protein
MNPTLTKRITYFGQSVFVGCDGQCDKAWGMQVRPRVPGDDDKYLPDSELGVAPIDPGTYEGECAKPTRRPMTGDAMNKWCVRQCERSDMADHLDDVSVPDFFRS